MGSMSYPTYDFSNALKQFTLRLRSAHQIRLDLGVLIYRTSRYDFVY